MIVIALVLCFVAGTAYSRGVSSVAANALGVVLSPLGRLAGHIHAFFDEQAVYFRDIKTLSDKNDALKAENEALKKRVSELEPYQKENEALYGFLELKRDVTDIRFVSASVIARSASNYTADFTLDKGSIHGVEKDMAVISSDKSLLGVIVETAATYSRGKLLSSYDLSLGVRNERTGAPAVLSGSLALARENLCRVADLADDADYKEGDILRTSGLGTVYPAGLYVGSVREVRADPLGDAFEAVIVPSADIFATDTVMIVTGFDRSFEAVEPEATVGETASGVTQDGLASPDNG